MTKFRLKFELWVNIVWGLLILFFIVGSLACYSEKAGPGLMFVAVMWVIIEIINRALASMKMLKLLSDASFDVLLGNINKAIGEEKKSDDDEIK